MERVVQKKAEDRFTDLTEPFEYVYPETEQIGGVCYKHIYGGIYQPEQPVILKYQEYCDLLEQYWDLSFLVEKPKKKGNDCEEKNFLGSYYETDEKGLFIIHFAASKTMKKCDIYEMYRRCRFEEREFENFLKETGFGEVDLNKIEEETGFHNHEDKYPESKLCQFQHPDKQNTYMGYQKHIQINNGIGYLIEPGIYYFPPKEQKYLENKLVLQMWTTVETDLAALGYVCDPFHICIDIGVSYVALGKENFEKLKKIQNTLQNSVFVEFPKKSKKEISDGESCWISAEEIEESAKKSEKELEKAKKELLQELESSQISKEELLPGMGVLDLSLSYKYVFQERTGIEKYDAAYLQGDKLILRNYKSGTMQKEEIELCMLEELIIRKEEELNGGFTINRDIYAIDCNKEKEVLTKEAYELWKRIKKTESK